MIDIEGCVDIERIGQGGLGDVYRATRRSTGGVVAVKVLRDVSDESVAWHRTRRELTALVSLAGHANVVQLIEVLDLPDGPALVMEYAPGGSVAELMLRRDHPLTVGETALVGRQTASALVAAHERDIVHRDVKPQNLLIDAYGQVKLCDFGIAAMARSDEFQDRTSAISLRYASPEDLDDDIAVGPASDVYSLGATMLHMARGAPPTLRERLTPWIPPATDDEQLAALDAVMAACLHPSPPERPSAAQVADELERLSWSIDERDRALALESVDLTGAADAGTGSSPTADADAVASVLAALGEDAETVQPPRSDAPDATGPGAPDLEGRDGTDGTDGTDDTDDTELRPDRHPPRPDVPMPRRRWPVALVVFLLGAVAAVTVWPSGDDVVPIELVDRPAGLVDIRELDWPFGAVGGCLVQLDEVLQPVPCDEAHDLQRFAEGELDGFAVGSAFDGDAVAAAVRRSCDAAFTVFVGAAPEASELQVASSAPSELSWDQRDDRRFQCFLGVGGRRVVGDAAVADR